MKESADRDGPLLPIRNKIGFHQFQGMQKEPRILWALLHFFLLTSFFLLSTGQIAWLPAP